MLLNHLLKAAIRKGSLTVIDSNGRRHTASGEPGPSVIVRLNNPKLNYELFFNPHLRVGEAFMDGDLTVENGDIYDFLELVIMNFGWGHGHWLQALIARWRLLTRRIAQYNPISTAKRNVAHHYDLSDTLYDLFLDRDRQYSCAYYGNPEDSLDTAQENKKRHIAAKLLLEPSSRVLDIGSGWGGLALYLSEVS